ncbi:hypothetical protein Amet_3263 [Alkaliphilus metalliredigens QYMF]|uniref:Spo0E like sporulation regulatory protein n=1 Tax=Alkaliphilus metalliredigens (strain QYMF) TaxID=293826 RepID=A6TT83_ALKMQ|nr:Spo0E family sporulation regulatory protein-aspartic acid phosphatase [Alkaliphilus metalliredigens]ABR49401.1 hypothetical protein Amet_3263 [Alkaliphilus metalliredigens QYMF]
MINTLRNEKRSREEIDTLRKELGNNLEKEALLSRNNLALSQQLDKIIVGYLREYCNE